MEKEEILISQNLIKCSVCGEVECVTTEHGDVFDKSCTNCGYHTNSDLHKDSDTYQEFEDVAPELYKEVSHVDVEGYVWFPKYMNDPDRGMLFLDGTNKSDTSWSVVRMVEMEEGHPMYGKGNNMKPDYINKKGFGKKYRDALFYWASQIVEIEK